MGAEADELFVDVAAGGDEGGFGEEFVLPTPARRRGTVRGAEEVLKFEFEAVELGGADAFAEAAGFFGEGGEGLHGARRSVARAAPSAARASLKRVRSSARA